MCSLEINLINDSAPGPDRSVRNTPFGMASVLSESLTAQPHFFSPKSKATIKPSMETGRGDAIFQMSSSSSEDEGLGKTFEVPHSIGSLVQQLQGAKKPVRDLLYQGAQIRRAIFRSLVVIIDASIASSEKDFAPDRLAFAFSALKDFIPLFYDENVISKLSLVLSRDGLAEVAYDSKGFSAHNFSDWTASHSEGAYAPSGSFSLMNSLYLCKILLSYSTGSVFRNSPKYGSKEVLLISSSLSTCDDQSEPVSFLREAGIRFSVLSMSGESFLLKKCSTSSGGSSWVAIEEADFLKILRNYLRPLPLISNPTTDLMRAGFPSVLNSESPTFCAW